MSRRKQHTPPYGKTKREPGEPELEPGEMPPLASKPPVKKRLEPVSIDEITEGEIVAMLLDLAQNNRRATVKLSACRLLATMKGMLGAEKGTEPGDDKVAALVEGLSERRLRVVDGKLEKSPDEDGAAAG